jgi:hypothetical protein
MIRRRVLARQLKLLREQSGLTLEQAAPKQDFSVSKLSRITPRSSSTCTG